MIFKYLTKTLCDINISIRHHLNYVSTSDLPKREKRTASGVPSDQGYVDMCPLDKVKQKCLLRQRGCGHTYAKVCDTHMDARGRESSKCGRVCKSDHVICAIVFVFKI